MIENPLIEVIERMTRVARMHGIAFVKITWDAETEMFNFTVLLNEYVTVHYGEKHD